MNDLNQLGSEDISISNPHSEAISSHISPRIGGQNRKKKNQQPKLESTKQKQTSTNFNQLQNPRRETFNNIPMQLNQLQMQQSPPNILTSSTNSNLYISPPTQINPHNSMPISNLNQIQQMSFLNMQQPHKQLAD
eukprot:403369215